MDAHRRLGRLAARSPLAVYHAGRIALAIECHPSRIEMHLQTATSLQAVPDEGLAMIDRACRARNRFSVGVHGMRPRGPELVRRVVKLTSSTDHTLVARSDHGYLPAGWTLSDWETHGRATQGRIERYRQGLDGGSRSRHVGVLASGIPTLDSGNNLRQMAHERASTTRRFSRLRAAYIRPLFCLGVLTRSGGLALPRASRRTSSAPTPMSRS